MVNYNAIKQIAKDIGLSVTDLLALAPKNDPFYCGTPADLARGEWFADVYDRAGFGTARAPHLRRVHYWTVSQDPPVIMPDGKPYENTEKCWQFLIEAGKAARYLGLVPLNGIVDNKNPHPHVNALYGGGAIGYEINIPQLDNPHVWIDGFYQSNAQPYHLEIWCEKSTMNDVLLPVVSRYGANLVTFEGEVSITSVCVNLMQRIIQAGNKPVRIFYISDFDPAGNSMPVAMARKLEFALKQDELSHDVKVKPVALTNEQIARYRLPRIPIKETEKRAEKFEAAFGEGAVELDALEALYPGRLEQIVSRELAYYYSREAAEVVEAQQEALRQAVQQEIAKVLAKYQPQIAALRAMQDELRAIQIDTSEYHVERFDAEVKEDGDEWLFDSKRDYVDQIAYYKRHKGIGLETSKRGA